MRLQKMVALTEHDFSRADAAALNLGFSRRGHLAINSGTFRSWVARKAVGLHACCLLVGDYEDATAVLIASLTSPKIASEYEPIPPTTLITITSRSAKANAYSGTSWPLSSKQKV